MLIYFLYIIMPVLIWLVFSLYYRESINISEIIKKKYVICCGIVLFLIIALRHYAVGSGDGEWYYSNWKFLSEISFKQYLNIFVEFDIEDGYLISIWFLSHIFKDPQFIFVFYGLIVSIAVSSFVYKNCKDPVIAFVMFNCLGLWGFMVQGIRQGIAMSICLFAFEACKKRKLWKFIILVLLAMIFHASAVVFFAVYAFSYFKMNARDYLIAAVAIMASLLLLDRIFQFVNMVINDEYAVGEVEGSEGGFVSVIIYILILVATLIYYNKDKDISPEVSLLFYLTLCGFFIFVLRYFANSIAQRAAYYYMFGQMALLPMIIVDKMRRERPFISMAVIILCVGIAAYKASYSVLVPYYFFWQ